MALTITFYQMFLLANMFEYDTSGKKGNYKGSVVLLPSDRHMATMQIDDEWPIPLRGVEVDLVELHRGTANRIWNRGGLPPQSGNDFDPWLVRAEQVFCPQAGQEAVIPLKSKNLVNGFPVPVEINARFILSGGTIRGCEPSTGKNNARLWTFKRNNNAANNKPELKQNLTDIIEFTWPYSTEHISLRVSDGSETLTWPMTGDRRIRIANLDTQGSIFPHRGPHVLTEYNILHGLLNTGGEDAHPEGHPARPGDVDRENDEPICGGEQANPRPPVEP